MKIKAWCTGKVVYATKAKAIERIERQYKDKRRKRLIGWGKDCRLVPYLCKTCHQWHVGGTNGAVANQINAFGEVVKRKRMTPPKERDDGDTERHTP
jgi:hypothetical protein